MNQTQRTKPIAEINIVPYIDVMLVLLIIFMVTVPLIQQGVEIDLPKNTSDSLDSLEKDNEQEPLIVTVDKLGNLFINQGKHANKPLKEELLIKEVEVLIQQRATPAVYVRGDRNTVYQHVMDAMVALQKAGADKIGLVTQPPSK